MIRFMARVGFNGLTRDPGIPNVCTMRLSWNLAGLTVWALLAGGAVRAGIVSEAEPIGLQQPLITTAVLPDANGAITPTRHVELFDGRDLAGWTVVSRSNTEATGTWTVANGVLRCAGRPPGYLRTDQSYRDYRLTVQWRFVKVAPKADNSGVLVHVQLPDQVWPRCVQFQGKAGHQGDLFLMNGAQSKEHLGLDANTPLPRHNDAVEHPVGDWNTCEVICSGDTVRARLNGAVVNQTTDCSLASGRIGIQSEGGEIEIRKLSLDPLPP
jgi:hypothetical protein